MERLTPKVLALVVATLLLAGCSGNRLYKAELPHNLKIHSNTESVTATLDIFSVDKQCQASYQGTVVLDGKSPELGIPSEKATYLTITFASSSFWRGSSSHMSHDTLLIARTGYRYELEVSSVDDIYNVVLYEIAQRTGKKRELEFNALSDCPKQ